MPKTIISQLEGITPLPIPWGKKRGSVEWSNPPGTWPPMQDGDNYGVHTGHHHLIVVDLDRGHKSGVDGIETFKVVCGGELPETFTVRTPNGGLHLYFRGDADRNPNVWAGVDILGGKGYVLGPGSHLENWEGTTGDYVIEKDVPIAAYPDWLRDKVAAKVNKVPVISPGWTISSLRDKADEVASAPVGERNQTLNDVAYGAFKNPRNNPDEVWEVMTSAAAEAGLGDDETQTTLGSAYRAAEVFKDTVAVAVDQGKPAGIPGFEDKVNQRIADRLIREEADKRYKELFASPYEDFEFEDFDELPTVEDPYRIEGLLPVGGHVLISAEKKLGKTTFALNLMHSFVSSDDFLGSIKCSKVTGSVVYVNMELTKVQLRQYAEQAGVNLESKHAKALNLRGQASRIRIMDENWRKGFARQMKELDCEVLIIDPLQPILNMQGIDPYHPDVRIVLEYFGEIASMAGIEHLVILDHTGLADTTRAAGSHQKEAWADVIWNIRKEGDGRVLNALGRGVSKTVNFSMTANGRLEAGTSSADEQWNKVRNYLTVNGSATNKVIAAATEIPEKTLAKKLVKYETEHLVQRIPGASRTAPDTWSLAPIGSI